jgi:hypothetical protein
MLAYRLTHKRSLGQVLLRPLGVGFGQRGTNGGVLMRKVLTSGVLLVAVVPLMLSACGSSNSQGLGSDCGKALDSYHAALVASDTNGTGSTLTNGQEASYQNNVVKNCSEAGFEGLIKGNGYDYTTGPDAVAGGDPASVYKSFCDGAPTPNDCSK